MEYVRYKKVQDLAWKVLIDNRVSELPIKINNIAKHYNCAVRSYAQAKELLLTTNLTSHTKYTDAFTILIENKYVILYNQDNPLYRIRFSIAHELGHILLGHKLKQINDRPVTIINREPEPSDLPEEVEANTFASKLLAPACVLHELKKEKPKEIAQICNISLQSATFKAEKIKQLNIRKLYYVSDLEKQVYQQFRNYINYVKTLEKHSELIVMAKNLCQENDKTYHMKCPECDHYVSASRSKNGKFIFILCEKCGGFNVDTSCF